jgi:hypothetical protein
MDITDSIEPKSDQQNFDDYLAGPKIVTVTEVKGGPPEQPIEVHLAEYPGRPYKPSKTMRRVLVSVWGPQASAYAGRSLQLYGDPTVMFGGKAVGGIRIARMSHLAEPVTLMLTVTRGKRAPVTIQPLHTAVEGAGWLTDASSVDELQAAWGRVHSAGMSGVAELIALKDSRKDELTKVAE